MSNMIGKVIVLYSGTKDQRTARIEDKFRERHNGVASDTFILVFDDGTFQTMDCEQIVGAREAKTVERELFERKRENYQGKGVNE